MQAITSTKTNALRRRSRWGPGLMMLWVKLILRQRGLNLEKVSPNWLLLLVLVINIALWTAAFVVADNTYQGVCALDPSHTTLLSKLLLCR